MTIDDFARRFQAGLEAMAHLPLPRARPHYDALCASFAPPHPADMTIRQARLAGVPIRRYRPRDHRAGVVVYVHGGGFTLGSLDSHDGVAAGLAEALGREVVSVGYRRLPEARYGEALDDCHAVAEALDPVALTGDSAGGRLVLDLAVRTSARCPLGVIYPVIGRPTREALGPDAPLLSRRDVMDAWELIAAEASHDRDLAPPTACVEALAVSRDPLTRPLEMALARWRGAGAQVGYHQAENMLHGCLHGREALPEMQRAWQGFCAGLRRRLP
ncbi:alpha/beta hydrolase fold domain-containing protein [Halomonas smyrnensis]|uniref:alpha/beta hydrolase fold domain-containing protein n=1 Tax=Halomonas smyrnensis TaxID=720605 RepID=UPI0002FF2471|nr:alpha/beta hydrolase fold domain-containing protein [Halomonas smyrnensis]